MSKLQQQAGIWAGIEENPKERERESTPGPLALSACYLYVGLDLGRSAVGNLHRSETVSADQATNFLKTFTLAALVQLVNSKVNQLQWSLGH